MGSNNGNVHNVLPSLGIKYFESFYFIIGLKQDKLYGKVNVSTLTLCCSYNYHKVTLNKVKVCVK